MFRDTHHGKPCTYCLRPMDRGSRNLQPTRDHVVPQVHGGTRWVLACFKCNGLKGDMLPEVWASFMAANPGWWTMTKGERRVRGFDVNKFRSVAKVPKKRVPVVVPPELIFGASNGHREEGNV